MLVYKSKYGWSAYCSNNYKGKETHCYMPITFKAGTEPKGEKETINVTQFFLSCYEGKNGVVPKMVISEYTIVKTEKKDMKGESKNIDIDSDDLPFY